MACDEEAASEATLEAGHDKGKDEELKVSQLVNHNTSLHTVSTPIIPPNHTATSTNYNSHNRNLTKVEFLGLVVAMSAAKCN